MIPGNPGRRWGEGALGKGRQPIKGNKRYLEFNTAVKRFRLRREEWQRIHKIDAIRWERKTYRVQHVGEPQQISESREHKTLAQ